LPQARRAWMRSAPVGASVAVRCFLDSIRGFDSF
jgi:hypothetical protein